jgi:predicted permease
MNVQGVNPGIKTENIVTFRADMSFDKFPLTLSGPERVAKMGGYWAEFEQRLRAIPGVVDVGGGGTFPLNEQGPFATGLIREGRTYPPGSPAPRVSLRVATPDYFKTLGQPIVAGRAFAQSDTFEAPTVVMVNQSAAKQFWPNEDPIGTRLVGGPSGFRTVVGVVADVRQALDREPAAELYVPMQQFNLLGTTWVVHSRMPLEQATREFKSIARTHDPDLPVANFRTLAEVRSDGLAPRRVVVALIGMFGLLALVITAAGIAGVIAFSVNQRTQEFGIRMALGAPRGGVLAMVIREGLVLVVVGLGLGMAGALVLTKLLGAVIFAPQSTAGLTLLIGTQAVDTVTYIGVAGMLIVVALIACLMPARRAASVDPMVALRAQ